MSSSLEARTDAIFAEWDSPDSPGCAVGIIRNGELVYGRGFGSANLEHDIPITTATVFDIASTSKQFTAACIALLIEAGKLSLDDDARQILPELPDFGRPITLRHLLHHTSGWRDYLTLLDLAGYREADFVSDTEAMAFITRQRGLNFPPGERYDYTNTGYYLLGVIVERVTGQPLAAYAQENIFGPLGMTSTWFQDDHTRIAPRRATGYSLRAEGGYRIDMTTLDMVGDGAVLTCVDDLVLWDRNYYDNRLGQGGPRLIELMTTPGALNDGHSVAYGFGLDLAPYRGLSCVSHGGWFVGYRSEMMRLPGEQFTIICLANSSAINPTALCGRVADIWLESSLDKTQISSDDSGPRATVASGLAAGLYYDDVTHRIIEIVAQAEQTAADFGRGPRELAAIAPGCWRTHDDTYDLYERDGYLEVFQYGRPQARYSQTDAATPTSSELDRMAGAYVSDELDVVYRLQREADGLIVHYGRAEPVRLRPATAGVMRMEDRTLRFETDERGNYSGFTLSTDRAWGFRFTRQ